MGSETPNAGEPFSSFQRIGYKTLLYTPDTYAATKDPLVLFFSWNAAAPKHIAKYIVAYRKLFPNARILLVQCDTPDMFQRQAVYETRLDPALEVTKSHVKSGGELLVHSFSMGGLNQLTEFAKAWLKSEGSVLPMRAHMMDSSPGKGNWKRSHAAIAMSLPRSWIFRLFGSTIVHLFLFAVFLYHQVTRSEHKFVVIWRQINDEQLFDHRTPRVYLYSKADQMIGCDEVEQSAAEAKAKGRDITLVRFENSAHAGHVREDEGKYWNAVMEAWKAGPRQP
ncbi:indole-diterpene biosynthesis protein-like protein PaxU [Corynespora cassiicola Philippines]|uniref:Indole-diterpene biosynthesis protein-like protein PaxU n=1 Tax=Corynespora cassiicola Philippines TaxID=1448308 RepID=A0A2T2P8Y5_CORCC|nr:indole-diterpene biosynthesis protein-like protein PaxU [Corynespora cassiicola Philippines]